MTIAIFAALTFCAAMSGAIFKPGPWYESLNKPGWTPPQWAFPVVWSVLYIMIAAAGVLIWQTAGHELALLFWGLQLSLNALWSAFFFGMRRMDLAMVDLALMWIAIVGFIVTAWPIAPLAAALFLPYLAWVTTAGFLNMAMIRLNPEVTASA